MANLRVLDAVEDDKYLKASGAGTNVDPHVPEHLETNSADILTAAEAIQAAAEAIQTAVEILDNVVSGTEAQVDVLTSALPTGAATAALQTSSEALLTTIDADTSTLAGAVSGSEIQADIVSSALPTGASTAANQTTLIGHVDGVEALLGTIDADTSSLAGAVSGSEMQVDVVSSALPTGAATAALQTSSEALLTTIDADTSNLGDIKTAVETLDNIVSGSEAQVDVVAALPAGENVIGLVGASDIVVTITPTVAAEAHSAGDLLFDSTAIANAVRANGGTAIVQSILIVDKGDQDPAMTLVFANAETDFGAPGGVPDPDDTDILTVIGQVVVSADDYVDWGGASVAQVPASELGFMVKAGAATTSIYVAAMATGTPTPASTSDYQISIGLLRS